MADFGLHRNAMVIDNGGCNGILAACSLQLYREALGFLLLKKVYSLCRMIVRFGKYKHKEPSDCAIV